IETTPVVIHPEADMPVPVLVQRRAGRKGADPACILVHFDGKAEALKHPLASALVQRDWIVAAPDLRATGETRPVNDAIAGAPDHNSAEHALWLGRPLLAQWVFDVRCLIDYLAGERSVNRERIAVVGLGQAGIVAVCAAGLFPEEIYAAAAVA